MALFLENCSPFLLSLLSSAPSRSVMLFLPSPWFLACEWQRCGGRERRAARLGELTGSQPRSCVSPELCSSVLEEQAMISFIRPGCPTLATWQRTRLLRKRVAAKEGNFKDIVLARVDKSKRQRLLDASCRWKGCGSGTWAKDQGQLKLASNRVDNILRPITIEQGAREHCFTL